MREWRVTCKTLNRLIAELGTSGSKDNAILEDAQIKAALSVFNAATVVHDYMVIRLASGQPVPAPIEDETEKHFVNRLTKIASEAVGDWIIGVGMRLNLTVPVPITLSMVQRQRRDFSVKGNAYPNHTPMTGSSYDQAMEKECAILFGEFPLYPYAILTGVADHVKVGDDIAISRALIRQSGWSLVKQFWMPKRINPAQAIIQRQKMIGDAVRILVPVRQTVIQLALAWPEALVELLSVNFHLETAGALLADLRSVKEARPVIDKVKACLNDAAAGMNALTHKPVPTPARAGFHEIGAAMSAAKPVLHHLNSLN